MSEDSVTLIITIIVTVIVLTIVITALLFLILILTVEHFHPLVHLSLERCQACGHLHLLLLSHLQLLLLTFVRIYLLQLDCRQLLYEGKLGYLRRCHRWLWLACAILRHLHSWPRCRWPSRSSCWGRRSPWSSSGRRWSQGWRTSSYR